MAKPSGQRELVATRLGVMAILAVVLGVVVALLAIPFAGVAGIAAKNVARGMTDLPEDLETGELSQRSRIVDANGKTITTLYDENRLNRPLSEISRTMVQAIVSIEDYRFYQHGALDLKGTLRAFITNQASASNVQGGSSITQQLVKLTLVNNATTDEERREATADSYARKIKELRYAIAMEQKYSKDWILERYLNTAYFGDGAYGIQAASRHYFNVNANKINLPQAAMLAGLVKNPTGYDPTNSPERALARRNVVLDRMAQLNVVTRDEAKAAKAEDLKLNVQRTRNGCVNSTAAFFCDYVIRRLVADPALGATPEERRKLLNSGGLTIRTTLELDHQKASDASVKTRVAPTDNAIGALAMIEPGTGNVLALSQSRPMGANAKKGETYLNYIVDKEYGDSAGFQAGSTFKPFVLASAINKGLPLKQQINSPQRLVLPNSAFRGCKGDGAQVGEHPWNNSTTSGMKDAYTGTRESVNTYYAQLEVMTGMCDPYKLTEAMGIDLVDSDRVPTFTLGVVDVSPLEMAEAYATFASRGLHCEARPVTEILDSAGNSIKSYPEKCSQVMPKQTADAVNDILRGVQEPAGFGGRAGLGLSVASAAKTGTTNANKAVWYAGYTPSVATISMIAGANDKGQPVPLSGQSLAGQYVASAAGSTTAGPMWGDAMKAIQASLPKTDFVKPDAETVEGKLVALPSVIGLSMSEAKKKLRAAGFTAFDASGRYSTMAPGLVAATTPSGRAAEGSPISLHASIGPEPKKKKKKDDAKSNPKPGNGNGNGNRNNDRQPREVD